MCLFLLREHSTETTLRVYVEISIVVLIVGAKKLHFRQLQTHLDGFFQSIVLLLGLYRNTEEQLKLSVRANVLAERLTAASWEANSS